MATPRTGDLVFTSGYHGIKLLIRFFSDPLGVWRGDYVPHHVGIIRIDDGFTWVTEAQADDGVVRVKFDLWLEKHRRDRPRILYMPFNGMRSEIGAAIAKNEGTPYETFDDFVKMAIGTNKEDRKRKVCSTFIVKVLRDAGLHVAAISRAIRGLDIANTKPVDLYRWAIGIKGVHGEALA